MSTRKTFVKRHQHEEDVASPAFTRLFVLAFLVAAVLGVVTGIGWIVWNLLGL